MTNAIYCVASWPGVPSVAPCRDGHHDTCPDPESHPGCRSRLASRGFLCDPHFHRLEQAFAGWAEFEARWRDLEGERDRVRDTAGRSSGALGYANFAPGALAVDEVRRHLASSVGHARLDLWVSTQAGAEDAIQFAAAAARAYEEIQVVERPYRIRRVRCPDCGEVLVWNPPAWYETPVTVTCNGCARGMTQDEFEELEDTA